MMWRDRSMDGVLLSWNVGDVYGEEGDYDPMLSDPHCAERVEVMPVSEHEQSVRAFGERWGAAEQELRFQKSEVLKWNKLAVEERQRYERLCAAAQVVVDVDRFDATALGAARHRLRVALNPESKEHS